MRGVHAKARRTIEKGHALVFVGGARLALGGLGFACSALGAGPLTGSQLVVVQLQAGHVEATRAAVAQQHWRPLQVVRLRRRARTAVSTAVG